MQKWLRYGAGAGEEDGRGVSGFPCLVLPVFGHLEEGGATILVEKPKIRCFVHISFESLDILLHLQVQKHFCTTSGSRDISTSNGVISLLIVNSTYLILGFLTVRMFMRPKSWAKSVASASVVALPLIAKGLFPTPSTGFVNCLRNILTFGKGIDKINPNQTGVSESLI